MKSFVLRLPYTYRASQIFIQISIQLYGLFSRLSFHQSSVLNTLNRHIVPHLTGSNIRHLHALDLF